MGTSGIDDMEAMLTDGRKPRFMGISGLPSARSLLIKFERRCGPVLPVVRNFHAPGGLQNVEVTLKPGRGQGARRIFN